MLSHTRKPGSMLNSVVTLGVLLSIARVEAQGPAQGGAAAVKDNRKECEPYHHAAIADALGSFPSIWQAASIVPGDSNAEAKWASIQPNVPDISPKGDFEGNVQGLNYPSDDPDCWWTNTKCTMPKYPNIPEDVSIMPEPRTLGYGFDDGPNCSHNAFYDYLMSQNQKASHEVCIHGWSHKYMTAFQSEDAFAELYYNASRQNGYRCYSDLLEGVSYNFSLRQSFLNHGDVKPPYGDVDDRIRAIAHGLGLRTVMWVYDSQDWQLGVTPGVTSETVDKEYQTMIDDAKKGMFDTAGTIILAHEINDITMNHAIKFYPKLKEAFAHIVPIAVGMNLTQPYVEQDYTMPNFAQYIAAPGTSLGAKNATNSTTPTNVTASGSNSPVASSSGQVLDASPRTAGASRLELVGGMGGVKAICSALLGLLCAAAL
ncbi:hypothetical protein CVT26_008136 [Gymnopilus dilepis]|uniref:Chitin deacetylase n=1 Tax=Gymnopilus dilepis TaxID=231916 RepID=A0A409W9B9_9AGAR|nr:hypothetical protein CVT26_008136 [Gymnopilus dilepis]